MDDTVTVQLTERQARGLANLIETGRKVGFQGIVSREPADRLTDPEMADLEQRLRKALGETA